MDGAVYELTTTRPLDLLLEVLKYFGEDASLSLEGDLSCLKSTDVTGAPGNASCVLKPIGGFPRRAFMIISLAGQLEDLITSILPKLASRECIDHAQIERQGRKVFAAYDFSLGASTWITASVDRTFLDQLIADEVLDSVEFQKESPE